MNVYETDFCEDSVVDLDHLAPPQICFYHFCMIVVVWLWVFFFSFSLHTWKANVRFAWHVQVAVNIDFYHALSSVTGKSNTIVCNCRWTHSFFKSSLISFRETLLALVKFNYIWIWLFFLVPAFLFVITILTTNVCCVCYFYGRKWIHMLLEMTALTCVSVLQLPTFTHLANQMWIFLSDWSHAYLLICESIFCC